MRRGPVGGGAGGGGGAGFELGYGLARGDRGEELGGLQPHLVFFVLAPFLGAAQANRFLRGHVPAAADVLAAR